MNMISVRELMQRVNLREVDQDESNIKPTPLAWRGMRSGQPLWGGASQRLVWRDTENGLSDSCCPVFDRRSRHCRCAQGVCVGLADWVDVPSGVGRRIYEAHATGTDRKAAGVGRKG